MATVAVPFARDRRDRQEERGQDSSSAQLTGNGRAPPRRRVRERISDTRVIIRPGEPSGRSALIPSPKATELAATLALYLGTHGSRYCHPICHPIRWYTMVEGGVELPAAAQKLAEILRKQNRLYDVECAPTV